MRNLVAKHNFNRAATHQAKNAYSRKWEMDWDEIEPPKETSSRLFLEVLCENV